MFFIDRKMRMKFMFSAHEMDLLTNKTDEHIIKRLKGRVEGHCNEKHGFIIQVTKGIEVSAPILRTEGL
jgi:DNA-directed RNA polymerase subunit E'/Rpb7